MTASRQLRMENPGMRGNQYSDARGPIWNSLGSFARVTTVCAIAVLLIGGLTLRGFGIGVLDLTIAALYLGRRVGIVRAALWTFGLCILAAALMPPISCGRERAYVSAIKSDLRFLASQEEIYYADQHAYTSSFEDLSFAQSQGVTIVLYSSQTGWTAWATHAALGPSEGCALYYGDASTPTFAEVEPSVPGETACTM